MNECYQVSRKRIDSDGQSPKYILRIKLTHAGRYRREKTKDAQMLQIEHKYLK